MFLKKDVTPVDYRDTAMAFMLICFFIWIITGSALLIYIAIGILLLAMIIPKSMKYPAMVWLGFSRLLGSFVSKIILGLLFIILVVPVGFIRRLMGKDAMGFKLWKNGGASVFVVRNHRYTADDLTNQF